MHDNFKLYTVSIEYLEFLYGVDKEVYFSKSYYNALKPFLGIVIMNNNINYFIPFTSAKEKHLKLKLKSDKHFLIYDVKDSKKNDKIPGIIKNINTNKYLKLLSMLDLKKMIPVPEGVYHCINISEIKDSGYKALLKKELTFCNNIKEEIVEKANNLYIKQQITKKPMFHCCNYFKLERAMYYWIEKNNCKQTSELDKLHEKEIKHDSVQDMGFKL